MTFLSYLRVALFTTLNIVLNAATLGRYVWLEGEVRRGVFSNWAKRFRYRPRRFVRPATEGVVAELVKNSRSLRVFGAATLSTPASSRRMPWCLWTITAA